MKFHIFADYTCLFISEIDLKLSNLAENFFVAAHTASPWSVGQQVSLLGLGYAVAGLFEYLVCLYFLGRLLPVTLGSTCADSCARYEEAWTLKEAGQP